MDDFGNLYNIIEFADRLHLDDVGLLMTNANYMKFRALRQLDSDLRDMHTGKFPFSKRRHRFLHSQKRLVTREPNLGTNILVRYMNTVLEPRQIEFPVYHIVTNGTYFTRQKFYN